MIQKLEINGVHMSVGDDLKKHVGKKIGKLDRYIPKHARPSAHFQIKLKEGKTKGKSERTCEVVVHLPHDVLTVSETTTNIYASVDIVEEKLKTILHKYKEKHAIPKFHRRLFAKIYQQEA